MIAGAYRTDTRCRMTLRCQITNNPCGTDTRPVGWPCQCATCQADALIRDLVAALEMLISPKSMPWHVDKARAVIERAKKESGI